jgi:hypothetical protein
MARRDVFSQLRSPTTTESTTPTGELSGDSELSTIRDAKPPVDLIPIANQKKKRTRNWESVHRSETVTYRGVPREYQLWIENLSESLSVPRDEVVRACLEYGVKLIRSGQIHLYAFPKAQRMTLFPDGKKIKILPPLVEKENNTWLKDAFPIPSKKDKRKRKSNLGKSPLWQLRVTYRIPFELKEEIRSIAAENYLPVGEIVWFFIEKAMNASQNGSLQFQPVPKLVGKTLFQNHRETS